MIARPSAEFDERTSWRARSPASVVAVAHTTSSGPGGRMHAGSICRNAPPSFTTASDRANIAASAFLAVRSAASIALVAEDERVLDLSQIPTFSSVLRGLFRTARAPGSRSPPRRTAARGVLELVGRVDASASTPRSGDRAYGRHRGLVAVARSGGLGRVSRASRGGEQVERRSVLALLREPCPLEPNVNTASMPVLAWKALPTLLERLREIRRPPPLAKPPCRRSSRANAATRVSARGRGSHRSSSPTPAKSSRAPMSSSCNVAFPTLI